MQAGKQPQQVQGRGSAPATEDGRKNLMRVWNLGVAAGMIKKAGKWEDEWDPCEQELWQEVATWLVYGYQFDYTPPRSKHTIKKNYAPTTALEAFTGMINLAKNHKFLYDQRARDWFECTDEPKQGESRSALQHWYHSLKDQVFDQAYNRATKAGDLKDASSKPMYLPDQEGVPQVHRDGLCEQRADQGGGELEQEHGRSRYRKLVSYNREYAV